MKYKHNKQYNDRRSFLSVFTIVLGVLLIFITYVALTCSNELRGRDMVIKEYEDGSVVLYINGEVKNACYQGGLCND